jgi:preprotein translocase subunit YajC
MSNNHITLIFIVIFISVIRDAKKHLKEDNNLESKIAFGYACVLGLLIIFQFINLRFVS